MKLKQKSLTLSKAIILIFGNFMLEKHLQQAL